jgi:hypothetical protein
LVGARLLAKAHASKPAPTKELLRQGNERRRIDVSTFAH